MKTLVCCQLECREPATFGILGEGDTPDLESHACDAHLVALLEDGASTVWSLAEAT